ncbi:MAG: hypothetical protein PSV13_21240 [Lacunisphaera sp.]|nr:hypothetical protein [Lacunisphaera sp.]
MPTVTVKLSTTEHARLKAAAARRRTSKSAVLREAFARQTATAPTGTTGTLWDKIGHLAGAIDGPGNLSTLSKTLPGYGRSRRP